METMNFKRDGAGKAIIETIEVVSLQEADELVDGLGPYGTVHWGKNERLGAYLALVDYFNEGRKWLYLIRDGMEVRK